MKQHSISRSTAILIAFFVLIGLVILILTSCSESPKSPESTITIDLRDTTITKYPYTWDSVKYDRIISHINDSTTSLKFDITVRFNEEFIEIINNEFPKEEPVIWIGGWKDKMTFIIDNNVGVVIINHNTGFMTIHYNGGMKEIYTH